MNLWNISINNIKNKPLYSFISVFTLSLSILLLFGIKQIEHAFQHQIDNNLGKVEVVVGAKGSPLQLVLSSILHIDNPTGNISYAEAKKLVNKPFVKTAVPISFGDNYKGYKIVGTTPEFIKLYDGAIKLGTDSINEMEVIVGNSVAQKLNLSIGDTFLSSHGLIENDIDVHHKQFTVVGILKPTQKVIDRLIVTPLESIWELHHEHKEEHHHAEEEEHQEITALLLNFKSPMALLTFPRTVNEQSNMLAALPKYELKKLYDYTGVGFAILTWIAYLILMIASIIILMSLYKMVKEHAFDLALYRTYGATHWQLIKIISYEALIIVGFSLLIGSIGAQLGLSFLFKIISHQQHTYLLDNLPFFNYLQIASLVFGVSIFAILIAIFPIIKMNISTLLSHEK